MPCAMPDFDQATHAQVALLLGTERALELLGLLRSAVVTLSSMTDAEIAAPAGLTLVHRLKSEAGMMGFDRLSRACEAVDAAASRGELSSGSVKDLRGAMTWALLVIDTLA